jgi:hypothetical protein
LSVIWPSSIPSLPPIASSERRVGAPQEQRQLAGVSIGTLPVGRAWLACTRARAARVSVQPGVAHGET